MEHSLLKQIIIDNRDLFESIEIHARPFEFEDTMNYILVGLRRSGKSTMLFHKIQYLLKHGVEINQIVYINFEDERLVEFTHQDFNDILLAQKELSNKKTYYFFDEIQIVSGWEKFARRLADAKEFVYITGSNATMLSIEMESVLGGRYISKHIYPYTFQEYTSIVYSEDIQTALYSTKGQATIFALFSLYIKDGGFPESIDFKNKREYTNTVFQKILLNDIIARNQIRNIEVFRILIKKVAESVTSPISYSKLRNIIQSIGFKITKDSIIQYIQYAQDSYLLFSLSNYVSKFVERQTNKRYYFSDNGLLNLFLTNKDSLLLENVVAVYLMEKFGDDLYYFQSNTTGIDIDFYLPENNIAIQVTHTLDDFSRDREIKNLTKFLKTSPDTKCYIFTYAQKETIQVEDTTIVVAPIYELLLGQYI